MSKLTRKLWKVSDAVQVKQETTTREGNMKELMKLIKENKTVFVFVGIVVVLMIGNWVGL